MAASTSGISAMGPVSMLSVDLRGGGGGRRAARERQSGRVPGVNAAVQIRPVVVADHVERPDQSAGPAAALVVIGDDGQIGLVAESTEQRFEAGAIGQPARGRWGAGYQFARLDQQRAGNVGGLVGGGRGDMHQQQALPGRRPERQRLEQPTRLREPVGRIQWIVQQASFGGRSRRSYYRIGPHVYLCRVVCRICLPDSCGGKCGLAPDNGWPQRQERYRWQQRTWFGWIWR
jgi:hypothetical protein